jgi:hypothetical protein
MWEVRKKEQLVNVQHLGLYKSRGLCPKNTTFCRYRNGWAVSLSSFETKCYIRKVDARLKRKIIKETPRRRITVTSSFNEISTDTLGRGEGGSVTPPTHFCSRLLDR